ncbi:MAG: LuxR family transcriptional regulator [Proteobacteria bacterium]|nr:LuxR family transcriptional regulator [Pseudomonadota bacterium]
MDNALIDFHTGLTNAKDKDTAWCLLLGFAESLGLAHVHTWFGTNPENVTFQTTCPDWWIPYYMEKGLWEVDHLGKHCESGHGPIVYGVDNFGRSPIAPEVTLPILNFMKHEMALGSGIGFPVFTPDGQRIGGINLGISGTIEALARMPTQNIMAAVMAATAVHTKSHALNSMGLETISLTFRERECLLWLTKGLRTKEISDKLNLSDHTVLFHLTNAKAKLGAETREQAIARAVVLGLIVP